MTEQITKDYSTKEEAQTRWRTVYLITSAVHMVDVAFYAIFASGEVQDWAHEKDENEIENITPKYGTTEK